MSHVFARTFDSIGDAKAAEDLKPGEIICCKRYWPDGDRVSGLVFEVVEPPTDVSIDDGAYHGARQNLLLQLLHNGAVDVAAYGVRYGDDNSIDRYANVSRLNTMAGNAKIKEYVVSGDVHLQLRASKWTVNAIQFNHDAVLRSGNGGPYRIFLENTGTSPDDLSLIRIQENRVFECKDLIFETNIVNYAPKKARARVSSDGIVEIVEASGAMSREYDLFLLRKGDSTDLGAVITIDGAGPGGQHLVTTIDKFTYEDVESAKDKKSGTIYVSRIHLPKGVAPVQSIIEDPIYSVHWYRMERSTTCIRHQGSYSPKTNQTIQYRADSKELTAAAGTFLFDDPDRREANIEGGKYRRMSNGYIKLTVENESGQPMTVEHRIMWVSADGSKCRIDFPIPVLDSRGRMIKPSGTSTENALSHYFRASFDNVQIRGTFRNGIRILGCSGETYVKNSTFETEEVSVSTYTNRHYEVENRYLYIRDTDFISAGSDEHSKINKHPYDQNGCHLYSDSNHSHILDNVRFFSNERIPFKIEDGYKVKGNAKFAIYNAVYTSPSRRGRVIMPKLKDIYAKITNSEFNCDFHPTANLQVVNTSFHNASLTFNQYSRSNLDSPSDHRFENCTFDADDRRLLYSESKAQKIGKVTFQNCKFTSGYTECPAIDIYSTGVFEFLNCDCLLEEMNECGGIFFNVTGHADGPSELTIRGGRSMSRLQNQKPAHGFVKIPDGSGTKGRIVEISDHDFSGLAPWGEKPKNAIKIFPPASGTDSRDSIVIRNCKFHAESNAVSFHYDDSAAGLPGGFPYIVLPENGFVNIDSASSIVEFNENNIFRSNFIVLSQDTAGNSVSHFYIKADAPPSLSGSNSNNDVFYPIKFTPLTVRAGTDIVFVDTGNINYSGTVPQGEYFKLVYRPEGYAAGSGKVWDVIR